MIKVADTVTVLRDGRTVRAAQEQEEQARLAGSLVGALVYMSLTNGMNLMAVDISLQYIIRGAVLVAAVVFDVATRRTRK